MMKIEQGLFVFVCLTSQVCHCSFPKPGITFRCRNGNYIDLWYFCDDSTDCPHGDDEGIGCNREGNHTCDRAKFSCDGGRCKSMAVRCNAMRDCEDGTDELECGDEIQVKNCSSEEKYLCKDGLRCLDLEYTCDGRCNCFDCSDENSNCSKEDEDLLKECPDAYYVTANGPQCLCKPNSTTNSTLCKDVENCGFGIWPKCEQRCTKFKTVQQCSCYEGYRLMDKDAPTRTHCRTTGDFKIIYTNSFEIKSINNPSLETSTILQGISNCTLVTAANSYVYYATLSDKNEGNIFKKSLNSSGNPEKLIETDFAITSIAVDYITNNVYFTSNGILSVCQNDGRICIELKCCDINSITLAPKSGWMFYTQIATNQTFCPNGTFLTRSNMDGSGEIICTDHCYYKNIISIEMDESKNIIYLLQKRNTTRFRSELYEISLDSAFKNTHHYSVFNLFVSQIRYFSVYKDDIFFTEDMRSEIFYLTYHTDILLKNIFSIRKVYSNDDTEPISDLYVHNAAAQHCDENPCDRASCSGLCLLKPSEMNSSTYFLNRSCVCHHFTSNDTNHWCRNESVHSSDGNVGWVWVIVCILVSSLAGAGYYTYYRFNKSNWDWDEYYSTLRKWRWRQSEQDQSIVFKNQEEHNAD